MRHVTAQQLSAFLDGALSGVSRELVTRHLAACADCRERHALWHIYDEVLQRVLSWEPNERTMEEASARVELALTAERRGMAPPEFTSVLHPVIVSPNPSSPSASGLFPTLPPIASAAPYAPQPAPSQMAPQPPPMPYAPPPPLARIAPPPAPAPAPAPPPVQINIVPSANAYPLDPPEVTPAPPQALRPYPGSPPQIAPAAPPAAPPQWYPPPQGYLPPPASQHYAPPPQGYAPPPASQQYGPPPPHGYAPAAAPQQWYAPPPPQGYSPPIAVHENLRPHAPAHAPAHAAPWATMPVPEKKSHWGRWLAVAAALVAILVLASPWLPDVIRIHVPENDAAPTVELVRRDPPAATDPQLAERTTSTPPVEPYRALPVTADSTQAKSETSTVAHADSVIPPPAPVAVAPVKPAPRPRPHAPAHTRTPRVASDESRSEDEGGSAAGVEHSMTFIPVQTKTEVQLSPSQPSTAPAPSTDTVGDQSLPLLCGLVADESGAPIEGARVQVMQPSLTVRTDKRGRFCVALPAGEHTFLVDATGYSAVTRGVELSGGTFETRVTLAAAH